MKDNKFLVLDTETTGLFEDAEIVELTIIDNKGKVLIDTLVKPLGEIPEGATKIHGITTLEAKEKGREWPSVLQELLELITSDKYQSLVIFNEAYDTRLIKQTSELHGFDIDLGDFRERANTWCLMKDYARFYGERLTKPCIYTGAKTGYKWQSLINACKQQNLPVLNAHRALPDCQMTLNLANWMHEVAKFDLPHATYSESSFKASFQTESRQSA